MGISAICVATAIDILLLLVALDRGGRRRPPRRVSASCSLAYGSYSKLLSRMGLFLGMCYVSVLYPKTDLGLHILPCVEDRRDQQRVEQRSFQHKFLCQFGVLVSACTPCHQLHINFQHVVGDGNCLWRAVAKQSTSKWYTLKKRTIEHMSQQAKLSNDMQTLKEIRNLANLP